MYNNFSFGSLLDVIPFSTYVVDIKTYEVVYINKVLSKKIYSSKEIFCWKKIYGQNDKCSWCTIPELVKDKNINKDKKIVSTFFDESTDNWLQAHDELINWLNGRILKCTITVDITEQKEMQASLIMTNINLEKQAKELKQANEKYELLSRTDYLTGINNRRSFFQYGEAIYKNDSLCKEKIFVAMFDLDNFKKLNDTYGHKLGDKALIEFTKKVKKSINKESDIFGRLGGEEFALIIKSIKKEEIFFKIDNIRKDIETIILYENSEEIHFTVSIGLVSREEGETLDMTLDKADKKLYEAKKDGRNRTKFKL